MICNNSRFFMRKDSTWGWARTRPNPISGWVWTSRRGRIPTWCWALTHPHPQTFNCNKNKNNNNTNNTIFNINTFNHNKKNNYKTNNTIFIISNNIIITIGSEHLALGLPLCHVALGRPFPSNQN